MGEWSRTVGEYGENLISEFLKLIGWGDIPKNISIDCAKSQKHAKDGTKKTHGLDFFYSYISPLADGVLNNVCVSVKFTSKAYTSSPASDFKKHFEDLAYAMECFKISAKRRELINSKGYSVVNNIGVLFWISNNEETNPDIITKVANVNLPGDYDFDMAFIVDNRILSFIIQTLTFAKMNFGNSQICFYYPDTGKNLIPLSKKNFGMSMPVEYINSSILPLRVEDSNKNISLILSTIDPFSQNDLIRLIGLAQNVSSSWTTSITITFPDFDELNNSNDVRVAKSLFENSQFTENLKVRSYKSDFSSLNS